MRKEIGWFLAFGILMLFLGGIAFALFGGWGVRGGCCGGWWPWGMMGRGMMTWGFIPLGWWGMFLMILVPLGFLAFGIIGIIWFLRGLSQSSEKVSELRCPTCQQPVQREWKHCPHCGVPLEH